MILRERPSGLRLFFILRGSILSGIWRVLLANVLLAIAVTASGGRLFGITVALTPIPFTLIGLPLAIFLGFRNNAAYDRYWEARKLWGSLVADAQNFARQCLTLIRLEPPQPAVGDLQDIRVRMLYRTMAYAHALRHRLRGTRAGDEMRALLLPEEWERVQRVTHAPNHLMLETGRDFRRCLDAQCIDPMLAPAIDATLSAIVALGIGCERIRTTPIPFSYTLLLHRTAYFYCFLLPFGLVHTIGFMTPVVVALVAYTFFGLDKLGDQIEEPFGLQENDLPLEALCRTIEINLRESLGEMELPAPLQPVNYRLM